MYDDVTLWAFAERYCLPGQFAACTFMYDDVTLCMMM